MNQHAIRYSNRYVVLSNVCPTIRVSLATPLQRARLLIPETAIKTRDEHFTLPN